MNGPYYHLDGSMDWLKTAVKTVVVYKDGPVYVDSIANKRAQRKYYAHMLLKFHHEIVEPDETRRERILSHGTMIVRDSEGLPIYGKTPEESLMETMSELSEYMEKFEDCSLNETLIALDANMGAYHG